MTPENQSNFFHLVPKPQEKPIPMDQVRPKSKKNSQRRLPNPKPEEQSENQASRIDIKQTIDDKEDSPYPNKISRYTKDRFK